MKTTQIQGERTILLFEDDAQMMDAMTKLLIAARFRCLPTSSVDAARRVLGYAGADLLVARLRPEDREVHALIRHARRERGLPVISIFESADRPAELPDDSTCLDADHVRTPAGERALLRLVKNALTVRRPLRAVA